MSEIRSQATPARDELAEAIKGYGKSFLGECEEVDVAKIEHSFDCMADGLAEYLTEDAGWSKPRTVNDVDQLEALPAGTVLRNNKSGRVFEKARDKGAGKSKWMRMRDRWVYETYEILNGSTWTVLFTPGGE
ncbi:hypothetical protein [Rhodococcus qingshengii]|uniref:hypothetical protein n=1 Tax=Rhodococcus qingshengii TaxID=334542 RepID=UPI001C601C92|nr:hypothetical protein [Rhodococcus qingshengii]MBW4813333.1 hypothetical protein [Rhodococcus qingshengii]